MAEFYPVRLKVVTGTFPEAITDDNPRGELIEGMWFIVVERDRLPIRKLFHRPFESEGEAERFTHTLDPDTSTDTLEWFFPTFREDNVLEMPRD